MLTWLNANLGNIVVILILLVIVFFSFRSVIRNRRQGKSSCGCGCGSCAMSGSCHNKQTWELESVRRTGSAISRPGRSRRTMPMQTDLTVSEGRCALEQEWIKKMYKVLLKIDGMSCSMCEAHMNDTIRSRYSVNKLKSSFKKGTTEFLVQEAPSEEDLRALIDPTGYRLISCTVEKESSEEKTHASFFGFLKR